MYNVVVKRWRIFQNILGFGSESGWLTKINHFFPVHRYIHAAALTWNCVEFASRPGPRRPIHSATTKGQVYKPCRLLKFKVQHYCETSDEKIVLCISNVLLSFFNAWHHFIIVLKRWTSLYFVERSEVGRVLVDLFPVSDLVEVEISASRVVVGKSVVSPSLDVDGHQIASGKVQRSEHVAV